MYWNFSLDGKREFISGLHWQPLTDSSSGELPTFLRGAGPQTRGLMTSMGFDLAAWRSENALQVGLAVAEEGAKPGVYSIAAAIASNIEADSGAKSFLCAVEALNGRWLFVAQREGVLLPEGDKFGQEGEIRALLLDNRSAGDWDIIYAPATWFIDKAEEVQIDDLLAKDKTGKITIREEWKLREPQGSKSKVLVIGITAATLLLGGKFGNDYYLSVKAAEAEARRIQNELIASQSVVQAPVTPPWHELPAAAHVASACQQAVSSFATLWPGHWTLMGIECKNGNASAVWRREEMGWIEHLKAVMPDAVINTDGNIASDSRTVNVTVENNREAIVTQQERRIAMLSVGQRYGVEVRLGALQLPAPPINPTDEAPPPPPPQWGSFTVSVANTQLPPREIVKLLDGPGFRLDSVNLRYFDGVLTWNIEGTQYVQP